MAVVDGGWCDCAVTCCCGGGGDCGIYVGKNVCAVAWVKEFAIGADAVGNEGDATWTG